jgi:peptidoglycan/LPS O-acetylase OafA/YrhL
MPEGEGSAGSIPHISALDGLRGLAVAGVLLFHGGHLKGGYLGVDFFFTLSGFLITSLLLAESRRTGHVGLGGFWSRRARRLLPALAVLMVGVAIYAATLAQPAELSQIRADALGTLAYVANWHEVFSHASYFALFSAPSPLNHTWSLAIEEQFYVIWPLVFVALLAGFARRAPKAVLVTALVLAAISSVLMIALYDPADSNHAYFGTDTRAAAILLGAALAAWLAIAGPARDRRRRFTIEALGLAGVAVLALAWTRLDGQSSTLYRGGFLVCGLAATGVIAAATHPERGPVARVFSIRPLCALGLISYGVYLYHWPIDVALTEDRAHLHGWPLFFLQTAITIALAVVSYRLVEQPIRRGALSSVQWRVLTPAVTIALVVALVASTGGAESPVPAGPVEDTTRILAATLARQDAAPGAKRLMVVGNSVAFLLAPAFQKLRVDPPLAVFNAGVLGCVFPPEIVRPPALVNGHELVLAPCHPAWETAAVRAFRPNVVLWIMPTRGWLGGTYQGRQVQGCSARFDSIYQRDLRREIVRLGARGAKVVVTTSAYSRRVGVVNDPVEDDCENNLRRAVADATGAQLVDLFGFVCPDGQCRSKLNGVTLRPDGLHYEGPGAAVVAKWLRDQVRGLK